MKINSNDYRLIKESGLLNMRWYSEKYPDVKILGMDPIVHYVKYGAYLGRNPGKKFDTSFYVTKYFNGNFEREVNPLLHYLKSTNKNEIAISESEFHTLLEAKKIIDRGEFEKGINFVKEHANSAEISALNLLYASEYSSDKDKWAMFVNKHLDSFGIANIEINKNEKKLYKGICTNLTRKVSKGKLVSVIMPAYNAEETLSFAAKSILKQTWKNIELIIVDDCSEDATYDIAKGIALEDGRVKVLRNYVNMGPYVSKNRAVSICEGDYLTGHDADDWAHPERIENHIKYVLNNPQVKASATKMLRVTADGKFDRVSVKNVNTFDGITQVAFISTLFETKFFKEEIGAWDCVKFGADSEVINRCKSILGSNFKVLDQLGMICLDSDTGLTSHPEFGTRGRTSPVRKQYKKSFLAWHDSLGKYKASGQYKMDFPNHPRKFKAPKESAVQYSDIVKNEQKRKLDRSFDLDVAIITDMRFPGGNASTTLDEVKTLVDSGLKVKVFHCPSLLSHRKPISSRYFSIEQYSDIDFYNIEKISAKFVIVRSPSVISSPFYLAMAGKVFTKSVAFVVNNSMFKGDGSFAYTISEFSKGLKAIDCKNKYLFSLSENIKKELKGLESQLPIAIEDDNWHPLFDASSFNAVNNSRVDPNKIIIGRHGRDHIDKWPDSKEEILKAYPVSQNIEIRVLGGADMAKEKLGSLPKNWKVYPFGSVEPNVFLNKLDFFVYFPSQNLNEAFGRVVMEAIFAGVPCILPKRFKSTFGDMAFYCEVDEVETLIDKLVAKQDEVAEFCKKLRLEALENYGSEVLIKRINCYSTVIFDKGDC